MMAALAIPFLLLLAPGDEDKLPKLVEQLESGDVGERDRAAQELVDQGPAAFGRLRRARELAADPELRARLETVLRTIKERTPLSYGTLRDLRLDVDFKASRLSHVAREIERRTGFVVKVETRQGEDPDVCEMRFKGISVEMLLEVASRPAGLAWGIEDGEAIVIAPAEQAAARFGVLRIIDVRELTGYVCDKLPAEVGIIKPPPGGIATLDDPEPALTSPDTLTELVRMNVAPRSWDSENATAQVYAGFLLVRHRAAVCEEVDRFVAGLRETAHYQLHVRVSFVALKESAAERCLDGMRVRIDELKSALAEGKEAVRVAEQELTTYSDVRVAAFSGRVLSIVSGYSADGDVDKQEVRDGFAVTLRPTASPDRKSAKLELSASLCRLQALERVTTKNGDVQAPVIETAEAKLVQTLAMGESTVVSIQPNPTGNGTEFPRLVVIARVSLKK